MKHKFNIYKLHFTIPLHIGDEKDDYSTSNRTIQSDTLYAALIASLIQLGKEIPDVGDLGFVISSLFPFYQKDFESEAVYFFPKLLSCQLPELKDYNLNKVVKKINWLELSFFEKLINGLNPFKEEDLRNVENEFLTSEIIPKDFISTQVSQRVKVPRNFSVDAEPFYMDRVYFKDKSGLFFIVEGDVTLLELALNLLQYEGIGTDRNIGNGFFEYTKNILEINLPSSSMISNLSMFCPEDEKQLQTMLEHDFVAYDFLKRGGWITTYPYSKYRKNTVQMFMPASVFNHKSEINKPLHLGKNVDLKPNIEFDKIAHSIWRSGRSIFIPIKL